MASFPISHFVDIPSPNRRLAPLRPPVTRHSESFAISAKMHPKLLPGGLFIVLVLVPDAWGRFVPDSPPRTQMYELPERRAAQTATTTLDPPVSTLEPDPWECIAENITQYFLDVPRPSGNVLDAIGLYGDEVAKPCLATQPNWLSCTISDPKSWCGFTTFAAPSVLASYSTYVSAAASFFRAKSATMSILSTSCPVAWARPEPGQREWLKIATAHLMCYLQAHPTTDTGGPPSPTTPNGRTTSTNSTSFPTTTKTNKGTARRDQALSGFAILSTGLAILLNAVQWRG